MPPHPPLLNRRRWTAWGLWWSLCAAWATPVSCATLATPQGERLPPIAAHYRVTQGDGRVSDWYVLRTDHQLSVLKGAIDEVWTRDPQGRLSLERVFHAHQRTVDYRTGELAALGVQTDWASLASFVDLSLLQPARPAGRPSRHTVRLQGLRGAERLTVDWHTALQLPVRVLGRREGRTLSRLELMEHTLGAPPPSWPVPGVRSAHYLRLDAADFGDMANDPVVRLSEAMDVRLGWRQPHAHDRSAP